MGLMSFLHSLKKNLTYYFNKGCVYIKTLFFSVFSESRASGNSDVPSNINNESLSEQLVSVHNQEIREFIRDGHITIDDYLSLNDFAREVLLDLGVRQFIQSKEMSIEQLQHISTNKSLYEAIKNTEVQKLIINSHLTLEELLNLNQHARKALLDFGVRQFIQSKKMSIEQLQRISTNKSLYEAIKNTEVQKLIINNHLTLEEFLNLNKYALMAILDLGVCKFIISKGITIAQLHRINNNALCKAIKNPGVRELISNKHIKIDDYLNLNNHALDVLLNLEVRKFIISAGMTIEQLSRINNYALSKAIKNPDILDFIMRGYMTIEKFLSSNDSELESYENPITRTSIVDKKRAEEQEKLINAIDNVEIRAFIRDGHITIDDYSKLKDYAREALNNAGVRRLIESARMSVAQLSLIETESLYNAITKKDVQDFLENGCLKTIEEFFSLSSFATEILSDSETLLFLAKFEVTEKQLKSIQNYALLNAIKNIEIREFIRDGHITLESFFNLSINALNALHDSEVRTYIVNKKMSVEQLQKVDSVLSCQAITDKELREFFSSGPITLDVFLHLNKYAAEALVNSKVRQFILSEKVTIAQLHRINSYALIEALKNDEVRQFISNGHGHITIDEFLNLHDCAVEALHGSSIIRNYVKNDKKNLGQLLLIDELSLDILKEDGVLDFIETKGIMTIEEFLNSTIYVQRILKKPGVRQFILDNKITLEKLSNLTYASGNAIERDEVRQFIIDGHMTMDAFLKLSDFAHKVLEDSDVCKAIVSGNRITAEQLEFINTYKQYDAITKPDTIEKISRGEVTVDEIIGKPIKSQAVLLFNDVSGKGKQSTHTASGPGPIIKNDSPRSSSKKALNPQ